MEGTVWNNVTMNELLDRLQPKQPAMETAATLKAKLEAEPNIAPESAYLGMYCSIYIYYIKGVFQFEKAGHVSKL